MTKQFKTFLVLSMIAFFILGIYLVVAVGNISISYDGGDYSGGASVNEDYLAQRIAEEMAKQQQNLFSSVKEEFLLPDMDALTVELAVTAMPREFTQNTTAMLYACGKQAPMQLKDGVFTGRVAIPVAGEPSEEYSILLRDGEQYRTQVFPLDIYRFASGWEVCGLNGWSMEIRDNESSYVVEQGFQLDESLLPFGDKAISARIFALEDGKEIYTESLQNGQLKISHTFTLKEQRSVIWLYCEVVGASGMTYRYYLTDIRRMDYGEAAEEPGPALQAITPEGKTIYLPVY